MVIIQLCFLNNYRLKYYPGLRESLLGIKSSWGLEKSKFIERVLIPGYILNYILNLFCINAEKDVQLLNALKVQSPNSSRSNRNRKVLKRPPGYSMSIVHCNPNCSLIIYYIYILWIKFIHSLCNKGIWPLFPPTSRVKPTFILS